MTAQVGQIQRELATANLVDQDFTLKASLVAAETSGRVPASIATTPSSSASPT